MHPDTKLLLSFLFTVTISWVCGFLCARREAAGERRSREAAHAAEIDRSRADAARAYALLSDATRRARKAAEAAGGTGVLPEARPALLIPARRAVVLPPTEEGRTLFLGTEDEP